MTHGATFIAGDLEEDDIWPYVLDEVIIGMLDYAVNRLE